MQEYVPLKKAGATYKGLCPFHSEKTPSFHVNPDKGFFHCFGCGVGGDVFKFLELHEKVGFQDAVRHAGAEVRRGAARAGRGQATTARRDAALREALLKVHEVAAAYFREQLRRRPARGRGSSWPSAASRRTTIEQLGLGFAPPARDGLKARLLKQGFPRRAAAERPRRAARRRRGGRSVPEPADGSDLPRHRVGHRVRRPGDGPGPGRPKYLNSPETPIYSKGRTLYGLNLTKAGIRKLGFAVLVEGYFDFAQVFQAEAAPVGRLVRHGADAAAGAAAAAVHDEGGPELRPRRRRPGRGGAIVRTAGRRRVRGQRRWCCDRARIPTPSSGSRAASATANDCAASRPYLEYLLDRRGRGLDFEHDENRRQFLGKMLRSRPDSGRGRAGPVRATGWPTRRGLPKTSSGPKSGRRPSSGRPTLTRRELPGFGHAQTGRKRPDLGAHPPDRPRPWRRSGRPRRRGPGAAWPARDIFEVARSLHDEPPELLPSALLQRLSTVDAQLVTEHRRRADAPGAALGDCVRALKRLRWERERAAIQREIDRLQELGAASARTTKSTRLLAAERRPTAQSHRGTDVSARQHDTLSIEEKYDEVRQLINIGKEKGYLLYDEVNELLPSEITSSDELDDLFNTFGSAGIEVIDSDRSTCATTKPIDRTAEGAEELELDLTPGALDKTNDPVRMYLREMGTVPLLTREGEVEIARRIERGKLAVIKSISRTPLDRQDASSRSATSCTPASARSASSSSSTTRRSPTSASTSARRQVQKQIDAVRKARADVREARREARRHAQGRDDARQAEVPPRAAGRPCARASRCRSCIREIEFTEAVKRRLIDEMKDAVERVAARAARDRRASSACSIRRTRSTKLKEEDTQEPLSARSRSSRLKLKAMTDTLEQAPGELKQTLDTILRGECAGRAGEEGAGRGQPPPRRLDRQEVHQPRPAVPRPDSGRQHRPDEGGRQVRVPPRLQVLDLRDVVDPPGDHPRHRRPGAHHPHPGPHDRDDQQADSHLARARAGARPRADLGGDRQADGHPGRRRSARC